ncbi:hypothetical protein BDV38DRAFT_287521 [Aspergillus pseudotamarii]|uniref:Uncharacterized protein n=1 Tax=Aspergillus pseudotamarii TaxID=132259 RepID=A0A5N6SDA3_ASPPS|nr:uncharacterized protein BDV38DRAFT_287521 [Aspergillus pseudotamarii]KAE8132706.1 hypothetical protein BDV38DRAFT_287521 [Aspergillus pseudotamarii]
MSSWKISFPTTLRQFKDGTPTDVKTHVPYTAFSSGDLLAEETSKVVSSGVNDDSSDSVYHGNIPTVLAINLSSDYTKERDEVSDANDKIELSNYGLRLPFWTATAKDATLYITPKLKETPCISSSLPVTACGGLGEPSSYDYTNVPSLLETWTIQNLISDEGKPQRAWLLVPFPL